MMDASRWDVVKRLFEAALGHPAATRAAFVQTACGADVELRREVESLLAAHAEAGRFAEQPPVPATSVPAAAVDVPRSDRARLQPGARVGSYEIRAFLAAGAMGEVYRAHDPRLRRDVALKVLPASFSTDPGRVARFEREARLLAALNHPHIAAIHSVDDRDGLHALVLELVEGPTLADRLTRGPVPMAEALAFARQIAEALEAAHEKGIVHRDLKPANIKVTAEGTVKVLDFGLAKALAGDGAGAAPALTQDDTREGTIAGTVAYMSPEQAQGKPVDKRTDIWAFGCVLYEVLTGRAAFARETLSGTLAAILEREPDWAALPAGISPLVDRVLRRCLEKDPRNRLRDIGDARIEFDGAFETPGAGAQPTPLRSPPPRWRVALPWMSAILMVLAVTAIVWSFRNPSSQPVARLIVPVDTRARLNPATPAVSPDGQYLAYTWGSEGARTLSLHRMSGPDGPPLAEFVDGSYPFFSPDSAWLGFFVEGELRKVSVRGGVPQTVAPAPDGRGASWGDDGRIVFAPSFRSGLVRVSADGGKPQMVTTLDTQLDESSHRLPHVLPGARAVICTSFHTRGSAVVAISIETGERHMLIDGAQFARYVNTGHLVYAQAGRLMAVPFDVGRLALSGVPVPLFDTFQDETEGLFAVSDAGLLIYRSGSEGSSTLVWVNRAGVATPLAKQLRNYVHPRVSPDGQRIVAVSRRNLWVYDVPRDALSQLTFEGGNFPVWTPDGQRVIYGRARTGTGWDIFWKPADLSGPEEGLVTRTLDQVPTGANPSPDGQLLPFKETAPDTSSDIWLLSMKGGAERVFLKSPAEERTASLSPDARFLAYMSNQLGNHEIFIRPLTGPGGVRRVSYDGGAEPLWAPNGELFFRNRDQVLVVSVTTRPELVVSAPLKLFDGPYALSAAQDRNYDVTSNGQRLLMVRQANPDEGTVRLNAVVNWQEELKRLVPPN